MFVTSMTWIMLNINVTITNKSKLKQKVKILWAVLCSCGTFWTSLWVVLDLDDGPFWFIGRFGHFLWSLICQTKAELSGSAPAGQWQTWQIMYYQQLQSFQLCQLSFNVIVWYGSGSSLLSHRTSACRWSVRQLTHIHNIYELFWKYHNIHRHWQSCIYDKGDIE